MKKRTITGILLAAIFVPILVVDKMFPLYQILMIALSLVASNEMVQMYEKKKKFPGVSKYIIMGCSCLINLSALAEWSTRSIYMQEQSISYQILAMLNINIGFLPMLILILLVLFSMLVFIPEFDGTDIGKALTIICYTGLGFAALTILRSQGLRFVIYMFIITMLTDIFAYVVGSMIGKHKMCPNISPHKTWEGAIGGTVIATIVATCFGFFYGPLFGKFFGPEKAITIFHDAWFIKMTSYNKVVQFIIIFGVTILTSCFGQIGDLVASKLKRTYEIKDYGNIFPGHGGVLDRLDSALFAALFLLTVFTIMRKIFLGY